jgi:DNA-binding phage protein
MNNYIDLNGREIPLDGLDREEKTLVEELETQAQILSWNGFENYWSRRVAQFYDSRGVSRKQSSQSAVFKIAQDLTNRIGIQEGHVRPPDYRDELEAIIQSRFRTRREFCQKTGLSEDMLSHVLARRKHLSIESLVQVLDAIGYRIQLVPKVEVPVEPVTAK